MDNDVDWIGGLHVIAEAGDPVLKQGLAVYIFAAGQDMQPNQAFYSARGGFDERCVRFLELWTIISREFDSVVRVCVVEPLDSEEVPPRHVFRGCLCERPSAIIADVQGRFYWTNKVLQFR